MATSGTLGTTVIDTARLIEHSARRAGISASKQTPDFIDAATESLYMLMLHLANDGINLWCLEKLFMGLVVGQAGYVLPTGTLEITNPLFSQPTLTTGTTTTTATSTTFQITDGSITQCRVGFTLSSFSSTDTVVLSYSSDGISWMQLTTFDASLLVAGTQYWAQVDPVSAAAYWKLSTTSASTSTLVVASKIYDLPVTPWNRDTYSAINNKAQPGRPTTNYFFEKLLNPQITLWPVPTTANDHLTFWRYRQIQDVGSLTQQLEVPARWLESITWQAAFRMAAEFPESTTPDRIQLCSAMADKFIIDPSSNESDGMPLYLSPNIRGYTK